MAVESPVGKYARFADSPACAPSLPPLTQIPDLMSAMASDASPITANDLQPNHRGLYDKAVAAVRLQNNDYAVQLLQAILKEEPGFLEGRQLCRRASIQKKGAGKKGLFGKLDGTGLSVMKLQPKVKKDPLSSLPELELLLAEDPFNVQANQLLFDAANAAKMPDTAAFALETVRQGHPENTKSLHRLAEHYMEHDQPDKAANIFQAILKADPSDGEARKGVTNSNAKLSMKQQKWDSQESGVRSLMKDKKEAKRLELESKQGMTKEQTEELLNDYLSEYASDQSNLNTVRKIAELLERLERWQESYQYFHYAWQLSNGDSALETKVHRLEDKLHELHLSELEKWIADNPDHPEVETQVAELERLRKEREDRLIAVAKDRVEKNPTDPQLRFELGSHLYAGGYPTEAIPELQRAKGNPHIRTKAMLLLAKCYDLKNMVDLAQRQLVEAVSELHVMDATKKDILYTLGQLYAKTGKKSDALEAWKQIYESDYGYRDVAKLVEESYS